MVLLLQVSGILMNTGHDVKIVLDDMSPHIINISGGPLSYKYRVTEINFHWGSIDTLGSEHTIDGQSFPAEVCNHALSISIYFLLHFQVTDDFK